MWNVNQLVPQEYPRQHTGERIADILFHLAAEEVLELPVDTLDGGIGECMVERTAEAAEVTNWFLRNEVVCSSCLD